MYSCGAAVAFQSLRCPRSTSALGADALAARGHLAGRHALDGPAARVLRLAALDTALRVGLAPERAALRRLAAVVERALEQGVCVKILRQAEPRREPASAKRYNATFFSRAHDGHKTFNMLREKISTTGPQDRLTRQRNKAASRITGPACRSVPAASRIQVRDRSSLLPAAGLSLPPRDRSRKSAMSSGTKFPPCGSAESATNVTARKT